MTRTFSLKIAKELIKEFTSYLIIRQLNQQSNFYLGEGNWYPVKFTSSSVGDDFILTMEIVLV